MKNLPVIVFAVVLAACSSAPKPSGYDEAVTRKVLDHHIETFKANDLEGVMSDYTEESILITPDRTYKGLAEIRENFVAAFTVLPTSGTTMTLTKTEVVKDIGYMVWKATTPTLEFKYATDTYVVVNGKILSQTYAGDVVPLAAPAPAGE